MIQQARKLLSLLRAIQEAMTLRKIVNDSNVQSSKFIATAHNEFVLFSFVHTLTFSLVLSPLLWIF